MSNISEEYSEILTRFFHTEKVGTYTLEKIQKACEHFGNPQDTYRCIHIAGTNGKGSVSKMIFQILKESGKKVGVFTSPHLIDIRERFETDRGLITAADFMGYAKQIIEYGDNLSYFEKCAVLAFLYFRDQGCEYGVIEVGIGGRLDATNIIKPVLSVITSIGYDHMEFLGDTLEEIAGEKGGIIKTNTPVILYGKNPTLEAIAREKNSTIVLPEARKITTNLLGGHQIENARIAYEAGKYLGISDERIKKALLNVNHHGRIEYLSPNLLIDGAHNEAGLRELKKYLKTVDYKQNKRIKYCFNLKEGKESQLVTEIFSEVEDWNIIQGQNPLLSDPYALKMELEKYGKRAQVTSVQNIITESREYPETLFILFGSLYLLGEVIMGSNPT